MLECRECGALVIQQKMADIPFPLAYNSLVIDIEKLVGLKLHSELSWPEMAPELYKQEKIFPEQWIC